MGSSDAAPRSGDDDHASLVDAGHVCAPCAGWVYWWADASDVLRQLGEGRGPVVVGLLREAQHPLADDVALDLVGASIDWGCLGQQGQLGDDGKGGPARG